MYNLYILYTFISDTSPIIYDSLIAHRLPMPMTWAKPMPCATHGTHEPGTEAWGAAWSEPGVPHGFQGSPIACTWPTSLS